MNYNVMGETKIFENPWKYTYKIHTYKIHRYTHFNGISGMSVKVDDQTIFLL